MEPSWVRAVYLYIMAFVGVVVIVFGVLGFALGVVHTAAPQLKGSDPLTSIATSLVDIADSVASDAKANGDDVPPAVAKGIKSAKSELHRQSRNRGIDEMLRGFFMALIGLGVYAFHVRRTEAGRRNVAPPIQPGPAPGWVVPNAPPVSPTA